MIRRLILTMLLSTMLWTGTLLHDVCGEALTNLGQAVFCNTDQQYSECPELHTDMANSHKQAKLPSGCPTHRHSPWADNDAGDLTNQEAVALLITTWQLACRLHGTSPPHKFVTTQSPVLLAHGKCHIYIAYQSLLI